MKKFLVLILLLVLASPVFAADWFQYAPKGWLDKDSVQVYDDTVTIWFKDLNPGDWAKINNKKVWYRMNQIRANCRKKTLTILSVAEYDLNNKVLFSYNFKSYEQEEEPIIPESVGEWKFLFMCSE